MEMELFLYDSPAFKNFLKDNPHEAGEVKFLESMESKEGMHAIDIGANIGITTVAIAKRIQKERVSFIRLNQCLSILTS